MDGVKRRAFAGRFEGLGGVKRRAWGGRLKKAVRMRYFVLKMTKKNSDACFVSMPGGFHIQRRKQLAAGNCIFQKEDLNEMLY